MRLKMKSDVALVALVTGKRYGGQNLVAGEKFIVRASDVKAVKALRWGTDFIGDEPPLNWEPVVVHQEREVIHKDENSEPVNDNEPDSEHIDVPVEQEKEEAPKPKRTYKRRDLVAE